MGKTSRKKAAASEVAGVPQRKSGTPATVRSALLHNHIVHVLLIVIIGFIAYSNTFHASFHFDDLPHIVNNPVIKDLSFFTEPSKAKGKKLYYFHLKDRYVAYLSLALNYKAGGLDVTGYHVFNLAVHVTNAILVYLLCLLSFSTPLLKESSPKSRSDVIALFGALLFVSHPLQTQAVTYIWQRVTSLTTMFCLLTFVSYAKWRTSPALWSPRSLLFYGASVASTVLAMKTKEISFTLPVVLTLYEFMFFQGKIRKRILYLVPFLLTMCIIPLALLKINKPLGEMAAEVGRYSRGGTNMPRAEYLFTQGRVIVTYIRLLFFPAHQNLDYDYPASTSFFRPEVFLSFLFLAVIIGAGIYIFFRYRERAPQTRLISFGVFWFFVTLSVESSIIPIVDIMFEHRVYLPSVGAFIAIATSLLIAKDRLARRAIKVEKAIVPGLALIVLVFGGATYARNMVWHDEFSLWSDVVEKSPANARGHYNLGNAYNKKGLTDEAIEQYKIALKLKPDHAETRYNLGNAYNKKGLVDEAIEQYEIASKLKPEVAEIRHNLGNAYEKKGWLDKAIEQYEIASRLKPDLVETRHNLGNAYEKKGWLDKAIEQYEAALRLRPDLVETRQNLVNAYNKKGSKGGRKDRAN
jgi:Tfp pilus assembly protein PilF